MARLVVVFDIDADPNLEDPCGVAEELLQETATEHLAPKPAGSILPVRQVMGCRTLVVSATWDGGDRFIRGFFTGLVDTGVGCAREVANKFVEGVIHEVP